MIIYITIQLHVHSVPIKEKFNQIFCSFRALAVTVASLNTCVFVKVPAEESNASAEEKM